MNTGGSPSIGMRAYLMSTTDTVATLLKKMCGCFETSVTSRTASVLSARDSLL